jgi:hypothetical protein
MLDRSRFLEKLLGGVLEGAEGVEEGVYRTLVDSLVEHGGEGRRAKRQGHGEVVWSYYSQSRPSLYQVGLMTRRVDGGMGVSRERVRQILGRSFRLMRHSVRLGPFRDALDAAGVEWRQP